MGVRESLRLAGVGCLAVLAVALCVFSVIGIVMITPPTVWAILGAGVGIIVVYIGLVAIGASVLGEFDER